jgi:phosphonate ABC transporter permease subunit PhnE
MSEQAANKAGRNIFVTIAIIVGILLVYAFAVHATDINLERPLDPVRQENLIRVLRLLADPDLVAVDEDTGNLVLSDAARITFERIIETIFMALLASTAGTILAVPVSFLAARNLMDDITAPLAAMMAAIVTLVVGGWLGIQASSWLNGVAGQLSETFVVGLIALAVSAGLIAVISRFGPTLASLEVQSRSTQIVAVLRVLLMLALLYVALALLADTGLVIGEWLEVNLGPFGFLGNFIFVLSDLLRLLLAPLVALLLGLIAASFGARYGQEAVLGWSVAGARVLTGLLTILGMTVVIGAIGAGLNWLYQFDTPESIAPIMAVIGGLSVGLMALLVSRGRARFVVALVVGLFVGALIYLAGFSLPLPDAQTALPILAAVGGGAAGLVALAAPPKTPFPIGFGIYTVTRGILNVLRSIEPLIMGIVFVVWVSLGPFAGIMALTLHSIAALGKLFSEQVEGISEGPVEAVTATGASRLQMVVYAVIPQIVPPFTAFALYRWDINVRMSTIIGFVGGGGIGFVLSQNIQQLRYRQAAVMMLAIAIVVAALDYASSKIRSRII